MARAGRASYRPLITQIEVNSVTGRSHGAMVSALTLLIFRDEIITIYTDSSGLATADNARQAKAATAAAALGTRLKTRLIETMQSEGPVAAIEVCNVEAPQIASAVSSESGLDVGRTSLQVRNPANAPDPRERDVLERWAAAVAAGTPPAELPVHTEAGEDFLWMKPIVVEGPCLACHGTTIPQPVAEAIAARYPADQATGYAIGDLRGAFVVRAP